MSAVIPKEGDRVTVPVLTGYKLTQERPFECRGWSRHPETGEYGGGCKCGENCDGATTLHEGTVERVIYWADNSIESTVLCDDGERRTLHHVAPHGDVCF